LKSDIYQYILKEYTKLATEVFNILNNYLLNSRLLSMSSTCRCVNIKQADHVFTKENKVVITV